LNSGKDASCADPFATPVDLVSPDDQLKGVIGHLMQCLMLSET